MSSTDNYFDALVALSDSPRCAAARQKLFEELSEKELCSEIKTCRKEMVTRAEQEDLASCLLNMVAKRAKAGMEAAMGANRSEGSCKRQRTALSVKEEPFEADVRRKRTATTSGASKATEPSTKQHEILDAGSESEDDSDWDAPPLITVWSRSGMNVERMLDLPRVVYAPDSHGKATF
jgi:hypothetical protein